jgi:PAP2 superfamily
MSGICKLKLLPHEWIFGAFLVILWGRLLIGVGPFDPTTLLFFILLLINGLIILWSTLQETAVTWRFRLWFYPIVINVVFMNMKSALQKISGNHFDSVLAGYDKILFGEILSIRAQGLVTPILTEILSFCYLLFFPYLMISWFSYSRRGLPVFRKLVIGMFTIYGFGFLGYSLVPAAGPHLAFPGLFSVPLVGWAITRFNAIVVENGSNGVDVFPSLHCAVSCFLLFFDRQHTPWRYRLYFVPCIGIWLATIYLRYHYFTDLIVGFALAWFALSLVKRWEKTTTIQ